jgi:hypothetical protein
VPRNPPHIGRTEVDIFPLVIKNQLKSISGIDEIAACSVEEALRFACGARSIENE